MFVQKAQSFATEMIKPLEPVGIVNKISYVLLIIF